MLMMAPVSSISTKNDKQKQNKSISYKKNPDAPKRFRSPFILFSQAKLGKIKEQQGSCASLTNMAKQVAKQWSEINCTNERHHWEEEARKDKLRYYHEKQMYKGPWRIVNKRSKKDPNAPKRPMSAFLHFAQTERAVLKQMNPKLTFSEISTHLSENWKALSYEKRKPHLEWELKERAIYNKKAAAYKIKKEKEKQLKEERAKEAALLKEKLSIEMKKIYNSKFPIPSQPSQPIQTSYDVMFDKSKSNSKFVVESNKITNDNFYQRNNEKSEAAQTAISQSYTNENRFTTYDQSQKNHSKKLSNTKAEPQSKFQSPTKGYRNVATFEIGAVGNHRINFEYHNGVQSPIPTMTLNRSSRMPSYTPIVVPSSSLVCEEKITLNNNCENSNQYSRQVLCELEQNFDRSYHLSNLNESYYQKNIPQDLKENHKPCHNNENHFNDRDNMQKIIHTNNEMLLPDIIFDITKKHHSNDTFIPNDYIDNGNNFKDHNVEAAKLSPQADASTMIDDVSYEIIFPDAISSPSLEPIALNHRQTSLCNDVSMLSFAKDVAEMLH